MYNIMIVDQQKSNHEKIRLFLQESKQDFEIIGEVTSAEQAESLLEKTEVHIIISDDLLPKKTGLQLFIDNSEKYPNMHMILFTDYNRFNSSKDIMAQGRMDFLFKPIRRNDVVKSIIHMSHIVDEAIQKSDALKMVRASYEGHLNVFRDRFLINLLHGHMDNDLTIYNQMNYFSIPYNNSFTVGVIKIDHYRTYQLALDEEERQFLIFNALNVVANYVENNQLGFVFINRYDELSFVFTIEMGEDDLFNHAYNLQELLSSVQNIRVTIGLGKTYHQPMFISVSYHQARAALRNSYYLGQGSIIHVNYIPGKGDIAYFYPRDKEQLMIYATVNGHLEASLKYLDLIFEALKVDNQLPKHYYQIMIIDLLVNINRTAMENGLSIEDFFKSYVRLGEINTIDNLNQAHLYLKDALSKICAYQKKGILTSDGKLLDALYRYVHTYYANKISLRRAAQFLKTTPYHLEQIIMDQEKQTFYDFCMSIRLNVSKELLKNTTESIASISEKIGFTNPEYFVAIFKQHFHMTPATYRYDGKDRIVHHIKS
ncbi:response regulator transcription factor [Petrocella sp. FN5]|uniref:response regulator transcription factor n=1 Tax=Petrocella sp. FN5 TaxID=3032002 RepID=UPI0023DB3967|nr:helix-turn-helix domain-containing protein [Petrocella sp. FN5]MDF1618671.1 response regulator [Petrocella sp. FN5]